MIKVAGISEPDRGRRNWKKNPTARDAVCRNRRGQRLERPFAHLYETGGMLPGSVGAMAFTTGR
jgi:hypothetical protein